ncbi:MAG: transporter [Pseudomonadota bacterium]|nr:transporter [Xanthomonadaceae bacterium]MDE2247967.1 transporter [Xanthomonadaceae bacterium]MDE3210693.1 transporter [Pseudomonadota bacterium]
MDFSRYRGNHPNRTARPARPGRTGLSAMLLLGLAIAPAARADNPGYDRPGLGFTPAVLDAGEMTIEQGLPSWSQDRSAGVGSTQYSADSLLRLGLGGALELQLGDSLYNHLRQSGAGIHADSVGRGDSNLALKFVLPSPRPSFSWGLLGSVEFTDGSRAFRNSRRQYLMGLSASQQLDARSSIGTYLEDVRAGGRDSYTAVINHSQALGESLSLYVEAAWQREAGSVSGTLGGGGLAWQATPRLQLDAGFRRRLSGTLPAWWAGLGISMFLGH